LRHQLGYGFGVHAITLEAPEWDLGALTAWVRGIFVSPGYTPPLLPVVALEVLALSQRPDADAAHIAALLERDPVLAARLLKIANSVVYRRSGPSRTLRDTVQRLGLNALRDLVLAEAINMRVFRTGGGYADSMEELRLHSMITAHLARLVCQTTAIDGEYAFLCGLLHDIGFAAILLALGSVPRGRRPPDLEMLWPVASETHASVGATVARLWNLPPDVALVIERHGRVRMDGRPHPLVAVVQIAEELAWGSGLGLMPKLSNGTVLLDIDAVDAGETVVARQALGIDDATMGQLAKAAEDMVAVLR
jgi:putative nucleotidyltransferase with HDIG domain